MTKKSVALTWAMSLVWSMSAAKVSAILMLDYIKQLSDNRIVAGMHNRFNGRADWWTDGQATYGVMGPATFTNYARQVTGKTPGMWSADFSFDGNSVSSYRWDMTYEAERQYKAGAMVNIMFHACNPRLNPGQLCQWDNDSNGPKSSLTESEWNDLITNGGALNQKWKARLDDIAQYLQYLKDKNVQVMFRPFHEMNQGVFWWAGRKGSNGTSRLYRLTKDYLDSKGLNNLIWVWNVQDFNSLSTDVYDYNPGSSYWDIASLDVYEGFAQWKYDVMVKISNENGGKPIAIGECAQLPSTTVLQNQPRWAFFMSWSELTFTDNSASTIQSIYGRSDVLTLDEMPGWSASPTPSPPSTTARSYRSPAQNRYLAAWDDGTVRLQVVNDTWEKWTTVDMGNGRFALKSFHGNYLSAWNDGTVKLMSWAQDWEMWTEVKNSDGSIALRSYHGTYLSAWNDGTVRLAASINGWEHWSVM